MRESILASVLLLAACSAAPEPPAAPRPGVAAVAVVAAVAATTPAPVLAPGDPVEGLRVATRVGCNGCHGEDGGGRELWEDKGKYKLYSANLTVKRALYDDAGIEGLLRHGRTHDGHAPFGMPVPMFQHLSDREVRDITAWLRALPAVANPGLKTSWFSAAQAKMIRDGTHPYSADMLPDKDNHPPLAPPTEPLALGRHLAMTSCTECHGPDLNGYPGGDAPSLVVAKAYSLQDFMRLMRTGITSSGKESKTGLMTAVGRSRAVAMTDDEVRALKQYLDSR